MTKYTILLTLCLTSSLTWAAKPNQTYSYTTNSLQDDQSRCQAEADYMARNNIRGHVWGTIGSFEGVGYGNSPQCNTCVPSRNMRLTGDARSQGSNGMWYRVRSWR